MCDNGKNISVVLVFDNEPLSNGAFIDKDWEMDK